MTSIREYIGRMIRDDTLLWLFAGYVWAYMLVGAIDRLALAIVEAAGIIAITIVETAPL